MTRATGATLRRDLLAGLNGALNSVPDGLASGLLAGVNPLFGLYAAIVGPVAGALVSNTALLVITTTSVASLATGEALSAVPVVTRDDALFVMVLLIGAFQILLGLLGAGRLARFVSYSVMTGFLTGIAVLTILSQLPTITGYTPAGGPRIAQTVDVLIHPARIDSLSLLVAVVTLVLALSLPRTRLGNVGGLLAVAIPSAIVALGHLTSVRVVQDVGTIPTGIPLPTLPTFAVLSPDLATGALAVATIILVQGAGVSQSLPNPDGASPDASRDFVAQGVANLAAGFFRGLPVGGSLGATALNELAGARTRWSAIFTGLWVAAIVLIFPGLIAHVAMPALGALLIVASASAIEPAEALSIWRTGWSSRLSAITTFLATLSLPIQAAVAIGVVLSAILYLVESSTHVVLLQLVERPDGRIEERTPPRRLASNRITVLNVYGHLFYAGARMLERLLPSPRGARRPVVILRLRGRPVLGATLIDVLANYADQIDEVNGRLYLSGLSREAVNDVTNTGKLHLAGPVRVYEATPIVGESTRRALADARIWLASRQSPSHDRSEM